MATRATTQATTVDAVCLGEALIDFFPYGETARAADGIDGVCAYQRHVGGAPANAALGLARLGVASALISPVGDDGFGRFLVDALSRDGVDTSAMESVPRRTAVTFVSWDAHGERGFLFYRTHSADSCMDPSYLARHEGLISGARVLHLCSNSLTAEPSASATRRALDVAARAGVAVSVDLNLRLHLWPSREAAIAVGRELVARARVLKADETEAQLLTGERDPQRAAAALADLGPEVVAVTRGAAGAVWRAGGEAGSASSPQLAVVDTTGAGDAFAAALIAGLLHGSWPDRPARSFDRDAVSALVEAACRAGALVCTAIGATTAQPRAGGAADERGDGRDSTQ